MTVVFVSCIFGFAFAGESMSGMEVLMIIGGFSGVLVMTNDSFLFPESEKVMN